MEKIEVDNNDLENHIDNNRDNNIDDIIYTADTESVIETCKTYKGLIINGCINRNLLSSMLFIFPAIYGYLISYKLIISLP